MSTDITTNIYTNITEDIDGDDVQQRMINQLDSSPNILSDKDQVDGYVGTDANNEMFSDYYNENITRADMITKLGANLAVGFKFYQINDAVGATKTISIMADSNVSLYPFGLDVVTGETGVYDITTDVFTAIAGSGNASIVPIIVAALQALQAGSTLSITTLYVVTDAVGSTLVLQVYAIANNTNVVYAIDVATGETGLYDITADVFTSKSGLIETITKVNFDAKIAASELVIGKQYLVIAAFTSVVYARDFDVLCIAASANSIIAEAFVLYQGTPLNCEYDYGSNAVRLATTGTMKTTPTIANTWGSQNEVRTFVKVNVDSADGVIEVTVSNDNTVLILTDALNLDTGLRGTYDPATDTFTPNAKTVSFKKVLVAADIFTAGDFDISECPAVAGAHWEIVTQSVKLSGATTSYDGSPVLSIGAASATRPQFSDSNEVLSTGADIWSSLIAINALSSNTVTNDCFVSNKKLVVNISTPSTAGDGTLTVYGTAVLIQD